MVLAWLALTFGGLETVVLLREVSSDRVVAPTWAILSAPVVTAFGVMLGGWLGSGDMRLSLERLTAAWRANGGMSWLPFLVPVLVPAAAAAVARLEVPEAEAATVASALTLDVTVVFPGLVYVLLVRTKRLPWTVIVPTIVASFAIAYVLIPEGYRGLLETMGVLVIPVELGFVAYLVTRVRQAAVTRGRLDGDFATRFRRAARDAIGTRLPADILTTEIAILYHAFRWPRDRDADSNRFTVHRGVHYATVVAGLLMVLAIEAVPVHLLVSRWSSVAAWVLTVLSAYAGVWLIGDYRAITGRPIRLTATHLLVRVGLRWEVDLPWEKIASVERVAPRHVVPSRRVLDASLIGQPTLRIRLRDAAEVIGMYGIRRYPTEICLTVDNAEEIVRRASAGCRPA